MAIKQHKFIVSDESLNRYGYRVLTDGIETSDFEKNPVILYNHERSNAYSSKYNLPIGKCVKLEKTDGKLIAYIVFDQKDEFAQKIESKVEQGILNATSVGFDPKSWSEEKEYLLAGQTRPTVISSSLLEISITDIPANANAVKLYHQNEETMELSLISENNLFLNQNNNTKMKQISAVAILALLSLAESAGEQDILNAITKLQNENKNLNEQLTLKSKNEAEEFVKSCLSAKLIKEDQKESLTTLAISNLDAARKFVEGLNPKTEQSATSLTKHAGSGSNEKTESTLTDADLFLKLSKENPKALEEMRTNEPDKYLKLETAFKTSF